MSTAFDAARPRTFNLPQITDINDPAFGHRIEVAPPQDQFNRKLTRYIYYPLDKVSPERKNEMELTAEGGDDMNCKCLIRTKGFLPKGKISPLEAGGFDWYAPDNLVEGQRERVEVEATPISGMEHAPASLALVGIPRFPGDELKTLTTRWANDRGLATGHVEIKSLLGIPWESGEVQKLNRLFVPNTWAAHTLKDVRRDIELGAAKGDQDVKNVANEMLNSCLLSERWATRHINYANRALVDTKFPMPYTSVDELLLEQLEIQRQDRVLQNQSATQQKLEDSLAVLAQSVATQSQQPQFSIEQFARLLQAQGNGIAEALKIALTENKPQPNQNRK